MPTSDDLAIGFVLAGSSDDGFPGSGGPRLAQDNSIGFDFLETFPSEPESRNSQTANRLIRRKLNPKRELRIYWVRFGF